MRCQSVLDLSTNGALYSVRLCGDRQSNTHLLVLSLTLLLFLYFQDALDTASVGMLFIHQTNHLLKLCVFLHMPFPWHVASRGGALPIIWCVREAQREPLPTAQKWSLCVFTPGSLSARRWIMGRARESLLFSSPHYSFGKLISTSLWPAIISSPVYFMAHFRISASLHVRANLHAQQCLYCVIGVELLCSVPCEILKQL